MCILPKTECWVKQDCSLVKGTGVSYARYKNLKASSQIQKKLNLEILNTECDCQLIIDAIKSPLLQSTEEGKDRFWLTVTEDSAYGQLVLLT